MAHGRAPPQRPFPRPLALPCPHAPPFFPHTPIGVRRRTDAHLDTFLPVEGRNRQHGRDEPQDDDHTGGYRVPGLHVAPRRDQNHAGAHRRRRERHRAERQPGYMVLGALQQRFRRKRGA